MTAERVLVGFDGSVPAVRALDLAAEEGVLRGTTLEIVYALPDVDGAEPVLAAAPHRVRGRHPRLEAIAAPVAGDPELVWHTGGAQLAVVGLRAGWGQDAVVRALLRQSCCPVVCVPAHQGSPPGVGRTSPARAGPSLSDARRERDGAGTEPAAAGWSSEPALVLRAERSLAFTTFGPVRRPSSVHPQTALGTGD